MFVCVNTFFAGTKGGARTQTILSGVVLFSSSLTHSTGFGPRNCRGNVIKTCCLQYVHSIVSSHGQDMNAMKIAVMSRVENAGDDATEPAKITTYISTNCFASQNHNRKSNNSNNNLTT